MPSEANGVYPAPLRSRKASIAARTVIRATAASQDHRRRRTSTTSRTGTRTAALIARCRIVSSGFPSAPEAAMAAGELEERGVERVGAEVGPERLARSRTRRRPTARSGSCDSRCSPPVRMTRSGSGQAGRVQRGGDGAPRRSRPAGIPLATMPPDGIDDLGPAGVVERDVEQQPLAVGGGLEGLVDRGSGRVGQLLEPAEQADPDALGAQLLGLARGSPPPAGRRGRSPRRPSAPSSRG